ncbi:hypothetical protein PN467_19730 [Microcystis aeruginosa CS-563/04]|nr:hypothetical protein [Microcystis aeruginosa]MDB9422677.1 hypothetical protein [Microcystis aeruginosa CS-563/04]
MDNQAPIKLPKTSESDHLKYHYQAIAGYSQDLPWTQNKSTDT